jgi:flagellar basal-body rod protein FlgF
METGNPLDIAMNDATVLGVQAEGGEVAFTRRGDLHVSSDGFLETGTGQLVLGEGGGAIAIPQGGIVNIAPDGTVFFQDPTAEAEPAQPIGQLLIRDASAATLVRRTDGLFEAEGANGAGGDIPLGPNTASVDSGSLEGSNVSAVEVMVNLLDFYRSFETQMKVIKSSEEMDKDGSRLMRAG